MYTVKISDSFCEWEYVLEGEGKYSIRDLIDILVSNTNLIVNDKKLIKSYYQFDYQKFFNQNK
jgi:hypothetical protein